jgi:O-antigen ligase
VIDQYTTRNRTAPTRPDKRGLGMFGWSVAIMLWVSVGRMAEIAPFLRGLPLAKVAVGTAFVAHWISRSRGRTVPILGTSFGRTAALLAILGLVSITFSVWKSQTMRSIGECAAVGAEFWLAFIAARRWRDARNLLGHLAAAGSALAVAAIVDYSGGRAAVNANYDPNDLAYVLVALLPICHAAAVTSRGLPRMLWYLLGAAFVVTVILTGSRGGAIGLAVVIVCLVLDRNARQSLAPMARAPARAPSAVPGRSARLGSRSSADRRHGVLRRVFLVLPLLVAIGWISWPHLPSAIREHFATFAHLESDYNLQMGHDSRLDIWRRSLSKLLTRPIGFGLGAFEAVDGMTGGEYRAAHNSEVEIAVDLGFLGLFLYLRMYVMSWRALGTLVRRRADADADGEASRRGIYAANLRISLLGNFTAGFFLSQAYSNLIWISFGLIAGIATAANLATAARNVPGAGDAPAVGGARVAATESRVEPAG